MSNSTSNVTYFSMRVWYNRFGSAPYQEWIYLDLFPIGIIGIFLNILSLKVLQSKEFEHSFYSYLRAYIVNSIFLCFSNGTRFMNVTRSIFGFSNTYNANWYIVYIIIPINNICYHYGGFLDIVLGFERVVLLGNKFNWFKRIKPTLLCAFFLFASVLIDIVLFFSFKIIEKKVNLNKTEILTIHLYTPTSRAKVLADTLSYVFDITPLIMEISLSVFGVILMKTFVKKKTKVMTAGTTRLADKGGTNISQNNTGTKVSASVLTSNTNDAVERAKKMELRLTLMTIILTSFSIL
jgi:hypothetical protein